MCLLAVSVMSAHCLMQALVWGCPLNHELVLRALSRNIYEAKASPLCSLVLGMDLVATTYDETLFR